MSKITCYIEKLEEGLDEMFEDLEHVDTNEMVKVVDIYKDLLEAEHYRHKTLTTASIEGDVRSMLSTATAEERVMLKQKLVALANMI